jgi:lipopolysaccharide export system permease protein
MYLIKQLLVATLLVFSLVAALAFVINLLGELQDVGKIGESYNFYQATVYVLLCLPHTLYQLSPMLILLGGVLGLGLLNVHHELIIMRCHGLSWLALGKAITIAALISIITLMLSGELMAPLFRHKAIIIKNNARNHGQVVFAPSGLWLHEHNNFFHVARLIDKNHLEGISRYEFNEQQQLIATYYAASMDLNQGIWFINKLQKTLFLPNGGTTSIYLAHAKWQFTLNPSLLNITTLLPEELSIRQLCKILNNLNNNSLKIAQLRLALWQRILQPLLILTSLLLAIPLVLVAPRATNLGLRMFCGIILGFMVYLMNAIGGQLSIIYQLSPLLAAILPILLIFILSVILLKIYANC